MQILFKYKMSRIIDKRIPDTEREQRKEGIFLSILLIFFLKCQFFVDGRTRRREKREKEVPKEVGCPSKIQQE